MKTRFRVTLTRFGEVTERFYDDGLQAFWSAAEISGKLSTPGPFRVEMEEVVVDRIEMTMPETNPVDELRGILNVILDSCDWKAGNCKLTTPVAAVLTPDMIALARSVLTLTNAKRPHDLKSK